MTAAMTIGPQNSRRRLLSSIFSKGFVSAILFAVVIFLFDTQMPAGIGDGILYVACVLIVLRNNDRKAVYAISAICSIFLFFGVLFRADQPSLALMLSNRFLASIILWLVALYGLAVTRLTAEQIRREKQFDLLINHNVGVFWIMDAERSRVFFVSDAYEKLWGRSRESLFEDSGSYLNAIHPDDKQRMLKRYALPITQEWDEEYRIIRPDGTIRWIWERSFPINSGPAEEMRIGAYTYDITTRKLALAQAEAGMAHLRLISDALPVLISYVDVHERFVFANTRYLDWFGKPGEQIIGVKIRDIIGEGRYRQIQQYVSKVLSGESVHFEATSHFPDGKVRELSAIYVPDFGNHGQIRGFVSLVTDVTERKRAEAEIRMGEQRYRQLFDDSRDAIYISTPAGELLDANDAWLNLFGYDRADLKTLRTTKLYKNPEDRGTFLSEMQRLGFVRDFELELQRSDGAARACLVTASVRRNELDEIVSYQGIIRDITERRQAEEEQSRLHEKFMQAQKHESLGLLAGGIAHDFNNLLAGILGSAGLLLEELPEPAQARDHAELIATAAQRAADLTNQMLAYAGKGRFIVQTVDLIAIFKETFNLIQSVVSKKAEFRFSLGDIPAFVQADVTQLRQLIMNLIANASDSLQDRPGEVSIKIEVLDVDRAFLSRKFLDEDLAVGKYVSLVIRDTGCGMDEQTRSRIFDPFFTTKSKGRGLGLAAVLGIIRGHRGTIRILSEPGQGSEFTVLLPYNQDQPNLIAAKASFKPDSWKGCGKVLVVDDEDYVRSVAKKTLERAGFSVLVARDGQEAIDVFRDNHSDIVGVVLDMTMPRMDGYEAYVELQKIRSDVRVILSSGHSEDDVIERFNGCDLVGFIQKPYLPKQLVEKLKSLTVA